MEQTITCINCPVGCRMVVRLNENGQFESVSGNNCKRGAVYAKQECTQPLRMVTAVFPVEGSTVPLSVKSSKPIPRNMILMVMKTLSEIKVKTPVQIGQLIVTDIMGTGADIVATKSVLVITHHSSIIAI